MRIFPAVHYTMGGLWVDYNLMTSVPGLHAIGEANFSDHGANRLGASALMQGLADGYFILPYTIGDYLASNKLERVSAEHPAVKEAETAVNARIKKLLAVQGTRGADSFHRELGKVMWDLCGMSRNAGGLKKALDAIPRIRAHFWSDLRVPTGGGPVAFNQELEKAGRVADFLELAELICIDALHRNESCGGHFREEYQTPDGEAKRDDEHFAYAAAWEYAGDNQPPALNKEPLTFEAVHLSQRSYK
jgi:succinate dehydrogenase / fumarate reductase, flavoprotein subunit